MNISVVWQYYKPFERSWWWSTYHYYDCSFIVLFVCPILLVGTKIKQFTLHGCTQFEIMVP